MTKSFEIKGFSNKKHISIFIIIIENEDIDAVIYPVNFDSIFFIS